MGLNKKSVDDINVKGRRVLVRCDFNVPLKGGEITDETRKAKSAKDIICKHNRSFGGSLTNDETMKQAGISRKSFYKYKKELRTMVRAADSNERIEKDNGL